VIPVVDIAGLASADAADRAAVAAQVRDACADKGFFCIVGHGVPEALVAAMFEEALSLFDLPLDQKRAMDKSLSPANRGYEPVRGQTLEAGGRPDLKEGFYLGPDLPADDPRVLAGRFNHGANVWPPLPRFRKVAEAYQAAMLALCGRLMGAIALSLDLPEDYFAGFCRDPVAILRLLHYPAQPPSGPLEQGAGAHTDFGGLTVLLQDRNGGLQVMDRDRGGWIDATPVDGAFVVNLGDLIARWTNDRYRSTMHRVINSSGRERYSVPFFFSGHPDYEVFCLPGCLPPGEVPRYPPTTVEAHLRAMYRRTYLAA
jgi:isopenicillin N synthase-like dioxygenase